MRRHILAAISFIALAFAVAPAWAASEPGAVEWQVGSGTYLAGRDFTVDRKIDGSLTATGETITVSDDSTVKGDAWIAARHVAVEGTVGGDLYIRAQDGLINGEVKGNVSFYGMHLAFGPDARIDGDVSYFAAVPAEMDAGARIKGAMKSSLLHDAPAPNDAPLKPLPGGSASITDGWSAPGYRLSWSGAVFFGFIAGIVAAFWPREGMRLAEALREQSFGALSIGFLWLIGTPILAIVAAVTIIGLPLAIIALLLWPLAVLAGIVAIILAVGALIDPRFSFVDEGLARRLAGIILATFLLRIGISLPIIGSLIWLAAVSMGIGAVALSGRTRLSL